jgi:hypothetical protein
MGFGANLWNLLVYGFILVKKKMSVDWVHGPVDHDRAVVYRSMVDHGWRWPKGSPELMLGLLW